MLSYKLVLVLKNVVIIHQKCLMHVVNDVKMLLKIEYLKYM